jgi:imidazolonepropionase-like amidohydrolase
MNTLLSITPALLRTILLALLLGGTAAASHAAQTIRYVYLNDNIGTPGRQVVEEGDDGWVTVTHVYKNNGRGPEQTERFRLAADGTFSEYHVTGTSTMGGPIDEHFERKGSAAEWHSGSERGQASVSGTALYLPLNGTLAPVSVAIAALAQRADGSVPLLPNGLLRHRRLDEVSVERDGQSQRVQLVAQTGIGVQPWLFWATTGARPRLFALADLAGEIFIEEGWQASRPLLEAKQRSAERTLLRDVASRLRHPMPGLTVVRNARIFDSANATLAAAAEAADVYVLRGRITAVLPAGSAAREADREIDAAGRVLLPGLFDMHVHLGRWDGMLHLAAGATTVRDMGNDNAALQQLLDDREAGAVLVPQIVPCGFLEGKSPYSASFGTTISTAAQARDAIDWYAQRGYPQLKIYNSFPKDILRETVAYAHRRGLRVSGHVPAFMRAQEVVEQGFDEIQHINQVLLNFLVRPETDTRTLARFYLPAEQVAGLDFDSQPVRDFIALLREHRTVIDPTVNVFDFIKQRDGELAAPYAAVADHMPPDVKRGFFVGGMKIADDAAAQRNQRSYAKMVEFIGRLYRAGVPIVAGTDSWAGITLAGELALYVQAGLTPAQVLQIATRNGATYSGTGTERGSVEVGKLADLILVDGDPTRDIADIRKVALVITQGHWLAPKALHEELGIVPFVSNVPQVRELPKAARTSAAGSSAGHAGAGHLH